MFWRKKAQKKSLEQLVKEYPHLLQEYQDTLKNKDDRLVNAERELSEIKEELSKQRQIRAQEEANKNVIIHYYPGKELFAVIEGDTIYSSEVSDERYNEMKRLRELKDVHSLKKLLLGNKKDDLDIKEEQAELNFHKEAQEIRYSINSPEEKEIEEIIDGVRALEATSDFKVIDDTVELNGIKRSIPKPLVDRFLELHLNDDKDEYEALKNVWRWLVTNPNARASEDMYPMIRNYNPHFSKEGFIFAYRWVKLVKGSLDVQEFEEDEELEVDDEKDFDINDALEAFVSNQWLKIKKAKKGPKGYQVWKAKNVIHPTRYEVTKVGSNVKEEEGITWELIGNVGDIYDNMKQKKDQPVVKDQPKKKVIKKNELVFTDGHTGKMIIRIGHEVSMPRNACDESTADCSRGLHACFDLDDYSTHGSVKLLVAICPRDIVSAPYNSSKFRSCSYLPVAVLGRHENDKDFLKKGEGLDLLEDYFQIKLEELKQEAETKTIAELTKQNLLPKRFNELKVEEAEQEVDAIVDVFQGQLNQILSKRIQPIE